MDEDESSGEYIPLSKRIIWPTSEHYFQAMKFLDTEYQEKIRTAKTPAQAKRLGQTRDIPIRDDWEDEKVNIMYDACYAKFSANKILLKALISTGDKILIEHTEKDKVWGDGGINGGGMNLLGKTLMKVRKDLYHKF